jgi:nucleoside-diphosphate-sugar epimerase
MLSTTINSGDPLRQIDLRSQRVAVTGATGFIGRHVLDQLRAANATVIAIVDRKRGGLRHGASLESTEQIWFDHPSEIVSAVRTSTPNYVVHLHAAVTTERTPDAVARTTEENLLPSLDLMNACGDLNVKRLILMGSGEEFGPVTGPFDDCTIADPPSPYGASKAAVTGYAKMFYNAFRLPVVVLRPSVVYGPGQAPRMLIPQVMHALAAGSEIDVTEGRQTRDFIYAEDVARGIVSALVAEGIDGHSYNLASGEVVTVKDCLQRIEDITRCTGLIQYGAIPYKTGEIFSYEPVAETTREALNWRPCVNLDEGLAKTWASLKLTTAPEKDFE